MREPISTIFDVACALVAIACAFAYAHHLKYRVPNLQSQAWQMGANSTNACGKAQLL